MKLFSTQDHMGLEMSKRFCYSFHLMSANFMRTFATMVEYRLSLFLAIGQVLKILWHFEILTWESMGKPKMWILSRKGLIVERNGWKFGTRCTTALDARFLEFGLGSFSALCKIYNFTIFLKLFSFSQFSPDSSKLYTRCHNHTGCHYFGNVPNIAKMMRFWNFTQRRPYAAIISKVLFLP